MLYRPRLPPEYYTATQRPIVRRRQQPLLSRNDGPSFSPNMRNADSRRISASAVGFTSSEDASGMSTPPLWKSNSPTRSCSFRRDRELSPNSKSEAIARGQRELMEMVENMTESAYELSLRDIVEVSKPDPVEQRAIDQGKKMTKRKGTRKQFGSGRVGNSGGLFLKMFVPFTLKKSQSGKGRVSPVRGAEGDWWKKISSGYGGSERNGASRSYSCNSSKSRSSPSADNRRSNPALSCWRFFPTLPSKHVAGASIARDIL